MQDTVVVVCSETGYKFRVKINDDGTFTPERSPGSGGVITSVEPSPTSNDYVAFSDRPET